MSLIPWAPSQWTDDLGRPLAFGRLYLYQAGTLIPKATYQDAAHTLVWGATSGTNTQAGIGTGLAVPYIVYGQILNLSTNNPATGNYLDTVTATITY